MKIFYGATMAVMALLTAMLCAQEQYPAGGDGQELARVPEKNKSISESGQITVYGDDVRLNKAVLTVVMDIVRGLYHFMGEKPPRNGYYPINIVLYSKGKAKKGRGYAASVIQVEGKGYKIRLVVDARERIDKKILQQGIMEALVLELTMRTNPKITEQTVIKVPAWIRDGLLGAVEWVSGVQDRSLFVVLKKQPDLFPVEKLFATSDKDYREMGKTRKALFRSSATAMVMSLQRQPEGKASLRKMLSEVAVFEGEMGEILRKNFPTMNVGKRGLQKLWNLQLAEMSVPRLSDVLSITETESRLSKLLSYHFQDADGGEHSVKLEDFDVLLSLDMAERARICNRIVRDISQLSYRSYPDYRPLLASYSKVVLQLGQGKSEGVSQALKQLAAARKLNTKNAIRVRDVLDWYQISRTKELRGDFSSYGDLIKRMEREKVESRDRVISPYMDAMEKLMQR